MPDDISGVSGNDVSSDSLITKHFPEYRGHWVSHLGAKGKCCGLFSGDLKDTVTKREPIVPGKEGQSKMQWEGLFQSR